MDLDGRGLAELGLVAVQELQRLAGVGLGHRLGRDAELDQDVVGVVYVDRVAPVVVDLGDVVVGT